MARAKVETSTTNETSTTDELFIKAEDIKALTLALEVDVDDSFFIDPRERNAYRAALTRACHTLACEIGGALAGKNLV
ncbi:MAG: hypothetical protein ACYDBH_13245 [Acidobacteriaceae bacterium]